MPKILSIHNSHPFYVLKFDNGEKISILKSSFAKRKLNPQMNLSDEEYADLKKQSFFDRGFYKAMKMLAIKDYTEKEVYLKLIKEKIPEDVIDEIIRYLKNRGYLNDERIFNYYVKLFFEFKKLGSYLVKKKLWKKGFCGNMIEEFFSNNIQQIRNYDLKNMQYWLEKKLKKQRVQELSLLEKKKIFDFLIRKGFPDEIIRDEILD